jgi:hypothetical protein
MHVHLIAPSNEDSTYIKPLWVGTLAAHTPPDVEITFRDDGVDPIRLDVESDTPDLVAISVNSKTAARAYAISDAYRARGCKVVLGGIHVTALPWIQNLAYWPINLMMHELAERKIAGGDRAWRKHRTLEVPFGL